MRAYIAAGGIDEHMKVFCRKVAITTRLWVESKAETLVRSFYQAPADPRVSKAAQVKVRAMSCALA